MNGHTRAMAELRALPRLRPTRLGGSRLGVSAPPSSAAVTTRLGFLTRWANAIGIALGKLPPADKSKPVSPSNPRGAGKKGAAARRLWVRVKQQFLKQRGEYLGFVAKPSSDTLDQLSGAPAQLDQWEVTFAAFGRAIASMGGTAPDFQPGPEQAKLVGPRYAKIYRNVIAPYTAAAEAAAKRAAESVEESATELAEKVGGAVSKGAGWIGWALAAIGAGAALYYGSKALSEARLANTLAAAQAEARARRERLDIQLAEVYARQNTDLQRTLDAAG